MAVVDLLQELTDVDTLHESEEGTDALITALCDGQVSIYNMILGNVCFRELMLNAPEINRCAQTSFRISTVSMMRSKRKAKGFIILWPS